MSALKNSRTDFGSVNWYFPVIVDLPTTSMISHLRGNKDYLVIRGLSPATGLVSNKAMGAGLQNFREYFRGGKITFGLQYS